MLGFGKGWWIGWAIGSVLNFWLAVGVGVTTGNLLLDFFVEVIFILCVALVFSAFIDKPKSNTH